MKIEFFITLWWPLLRILALAALVHPCTAAALAPPAMHREAQKRPLFALCVDNFSGRDRLAAFLPRIVSMNRAVSPSPGPSDRLLPVGEGKSVRPPAAGSWVDRLAAFLPRIVPMNRAVSPSPGPSDRPLPVGEGKSVRPPAAGSWKERAPPGSARRARARGEADQEEGPSQKGHGGTLSTTC